MEELRQEDTGGKIHEKGESDSIEEAIETCYYLVSALKGIAARSSSPGLREVLNNNLKNVVEISHLYFQKGRSAGFSLDSHTLSSAAKELETLARDGDFWEAFDALLAAQSQAGYPGIRLGRETVNDRPKMTKFLKSQVDFFNRLALENFPVEKGSKGH